MTGHWWARKDARRIVARFDRGKPLTREERTHLRAATMTLLVGPLELDPDDARRLRDILGWLEGLEYEEQAR